MSSSRDPSLVLKSPIFTLRDKLYCSVHGRLYEVLKGTDAGGRVRFVAELPGGIIEIQQIMPEGYRDNIPDYDVTSYEVNQIAHSSNSVSELISIFTQDSSDPPIKRVLKEVNLITETAIRGLHRLQTQVFNAEAELRTERLKFSGDSLHAITGATSTNLEVTEMHRRQNGLEAFVSAILQRYSQSSELRQVDWNAIIFESCYYGSMLVLNMVERDEVTFKDNFFLRIPEPLLGESQFSPLHIAAKMGHVHIVNWFLENRRFYFSKSTPNRSLSVAQVAVAAGQSSVVQLLARSNALPIVGHYDDPNHVLRTACISNQIAILDLLVKVGMKLELITSPPASKITPAHDAIYHDHIDVLNWLNERHFPWDHSFDGFTPLQYAVSLGRVSIVNWFYEKDLLKVEWTSGMNDRQQSLEHVASQKNQLEMLQWLLNLRHTNKTPVPVDEEGITLAHQAASNGSIEILNFLTVRDANCLNEKSFDGRTCAHVAAQNNQVEVLKWLADHEIVGQNGLAVKAENGWNCVHYAVQHALTYNHQAVLQCLYRLDPRMVRVCLADLNISMPHLHRDFINFLQRWLNEGYSGSGPETQTQDPPSVLPSKSMGSARSSPGLSMSVTSSPAEYFTRSFSNSELGHPYYSPESIERETSVTAQFSDRSMPFSTNTSQRDTNFTMDSIERHLTSEFPASSASHGISPSSTSGPYSTPSAGSRPSSIYSAPLGYGSIATTPGYASASPGAVVFETASSPIPSSSGNTNSQSTAPVGTLSQASSGVNSVGLLQELAAKIDHKNPPTYSSQTALQASVPISTVTCKWNGFEHTATANVKMVAKQACAAEVLRQYYERNSN